MHVINDVCNNSWRLFLDENASRFSSEECSVPVKYGRKLSQITQHINYTLHIKLNGDYVLRIKLISKLV